MDPTHAPHQPGRLVDGDLALVCAAWHPEDAARGRVPCYQFELHLDGVDEPVGALHMRVGDTAALRRYAGHLGYQVEPAWRGRRLAARAVALLLPFAHRCGLDPLWATCNPDNIASIRTLERVGAVLVEEVELPEDSDMYARGERTKLRFRLETGPRPRGS